MTTSKRTASASTRKTKGDTSGDVEPKHVGKDTLGDTGNAAQAAFDRVKDAVPSFDDVAASFQDRTDIDLQNMTSDAVTFVRRNPAVSLAAAAGIGVLIGVLATKRS